MKGKSEVMEDKITSSVFDNLLLLPDDIFWEILRFSCYDHENLPSNAGGIIEYEFWPHWSATGTKNANYVEPDLFVSFEHLDIIIEAKRGNNTQSVDQWQQEVIAYYNEFNERNKNVWLIAIDGIEKEENESVCCGDGKSVTVIKSKWIKVLEGIMKFSDDPRLNCNNMKRLFETVIRYLFFYGIMKTAWLSEIIDKNIVINNYEKSIITLKQIGVSHG
jgi:hypothetical protein